MNKKEKLLDGFVSNTVIGTGNNSVLFLNKSEEHTYISFLKPLYTGDFVWKFWYANTVDSTFESGKDAYAGRLGGNFTVKSAFIAWSDTFHETYSEQNKRDLWWREL